MPENANTRKWSTCGCCGCKAISLTGGKSQNGAIVFWGGMEWVSPDPFCECDCHTAFRRIHSLGS